MNKEQWDTFLEEVVHPALCEDSWKLLLRGIEDWTGYISHLEAEVEEAHQHLSRFGIGKEHWSLLGRLVLLVDKPKGNVFESEMVRLLAVLGDLVRAAEEEGWTQQAEEIKRAKALLEEWRPFIGDVTVSFFATAEEVQAAIRKSLPLLGERERLQETLESAWEDFYKAGICGDVLQRMSGFPEIKDAIAKMVEHSC